MTRRQRETIEEADESQETGQTPTGLARFVRYSILAWCGSIAVSATCALLAEDDDKTEVVEADIPIPTPSIPIVPGYPGTTPLPSSGVPLPPSGVPAAQGGATGVGIGGAENVELETYSIEHYATKGRAKYKDRQPDCSDTAPVHQEKWVRHAKYDIAERKADIEAAGVVDVSAALRILAGKHGFSALRKTGKKYIYYPNLDGYQTLARFHRTAEKYREGGRDLANEHYVVFLNYHSGQPNLDCYEKEMVLPSYVAELTRSAQKQAGEDFWINHAHRSAEYQAVIHARNVWPCVDDKAKEVGVDPNKLDFGGKIFKRCSKDIGSKVAGRAYGSGHGLGFAIDVPFWSKPKIYKALLDHGFVVGCESGLDEDRNHADITMSEADFSAAGLSCDAGIKVRQAKGWIGKKYKSTKRKVKRKYDRWRNKKGKKRRK